MTTVTRPKAKRTLKNISFEKESSHIALVSKDQNGPANGHSYALIMKANGFSPEAIEKMQQVKVTMELPDFLSKFFHVYDRDAKILATMMGYVEPADTQAMEADEAKKEMQDWIEERMSSFEIIKSAHDLGNLTSVLTKLNEEQYLSLLKDQEMLEEKLTKASAELAMKSTKPKVKEIKMDENQVEMVEKSALAALQKSLDEQAVELQKARDLLAKLEEEKVVVKAAARKAEVVAAIKDEAKAEVLFKAVKDASDEDFQAVVKALSEINELVEKSALFTETGAAGETEPEVKESAVAKAVKANLKK